MQVDCHWTHSSHSIEGNPDRFAAALRLHLGKAALSYIPHRQRIIINPPGGAVVRHSLLFYRPLGPNNSAFDCNLQELQCDPETDCKISFVQPWTTRSHL